MLRLVGTFISILLTTSVSLGAEVAKTQLRYKIRRGDTLELIIHRLGRKAYSESRILEKTVEANKSVLVKGKESILLPGQVLVLPFEKLPPSKRYKVTDGFVTFDETFEQAPLSPTQPPPAVESQVDPAMTMAVPTVVPSPMPTSAPMVTPSAKSTPTEMFPEPTELPELKDESEAPTELMDHFLDAVDEAK